MTVSATELAKDYDRLRRLLNEAGYSGSILVGPEVNHVGDPEQIGEKYAETFLKSQKSVVNYVTWHQYYLNGREAKVEDFVNPLVFNVLPEQIESFGRFVNASGRNVSMWLCACFFFFNQNRKVSWKILLSTFCPREERSVSSQRFTLLYSIYYGIYREILNVGFNLNIDLQQKRARRLAEARLSYPTDS